MAPVDPSSVLDARRLGRTPVGFIVGLAACSLAALVAFAAAALGGPVPTLAGLALAVLPVPLLIAGVLFLDRLEPEPRGLLVLVFGAGSGAAALIVLAGNAPGTHLITTPELGPHAGHLVGVTFGAALGGAVMAESLKGAVLVALLRFRREELDGAHDGVVYASMVGLGFALIANLYSYLQAEPSGLGALASAFVRRGILSPLWDPLFSSMIGVGVAYAAMRRGSRGLWAVGAGWVAAVALHAMWDHSLTAGPGETAVVYAILLGVLVALLVVVIMDRRRIVRLIVGCLPAYQANGVATGHDVTMLTNLRARRQARQWARLHLGLAGVRAMADYQLAATEFALARNRAERDLMEPDLLAVRGDGSLALMHAATSVFRRPNPPQPPWAGLGISAFGPQQPASGQPQPPAGPEPPGRP